MICGIVIYLLVHGKPPFPTRLPAPWAQVGKRSNAVNYVSSLCIEGARGYSLPRRLAPSLWQRAYASVRDGLRLRESVQSGFMAGRTRTRGRRPPAWPEPPEHLRVLRCASRLVPSFSPLVVICQPNRAAHSCGLQAHRVEPTKGPATVAARSIRMHSSPFPLRFCASASLDLPLDPYLVHGGGKRTAVRHRARPRRRRKRAGTTSGSERRTAGEVCGLSSSAGRMAGCT
jgi:hypothetical protein